MRIVCQQTILMKYHALFVIFEKAANYRWRFKGLELNFQLANNKGADQPVWMCRQVCAFVVHMQQSQVFLYRGLQGVRTT